MLMLSVPSLAFISPIIYALICERFDANPATSDIALGSSLHVYTLFVLCQSNNSQGR